MATDVDPRALRKFRLELERSQFEAALRMMESDAWTVYQRASREAFARYDAAIETLRKGESSCG